MSSYVSEWLGTEEPDLELVGPFPGDGQHDDDRATLLASCGVRRLSEVPTSPPLPLLIERLDPEGHTVLFGPGGVGKGVLASFWVTELVKAGHVVLILDYEAHATEWSRRINSLGGANAIANVHYVAPLAPEWTRKHGPLWLQVGVVRDIAEATGATFIVIDSIVAACAGNDPIKPETASKYASALQQIGRPALSLAHVTKADDARFPFGTVYFHNFARLTWSLAARPNDGGHSVLLTLQKRNNYASLGPFELKVTWRDGLPVDVLESGFGGRLADRIALLLSSGPMSVSDLVNALNNDLEVDSQSFKANSVRTALRRGSARSPRRFWVAGEGIDARWSNA